MLQEIRARAARYLTGHTSLAEFEDWLLPATWDIAPERDDAAGTVAAALRLLLAEFDRGDVDEDELKDSMRDLLGPSLARAIKSTP